MLSADSLAIERETPRVKPEASSTKRVKAALVVATMKLHRTSLWYPLRAFTQSLPLPVLYFARCSY